VKVDDKALAAVDRKSNVNQNVIDVARSCRVGPVCCFNVWFVMYSARREQSSYSILTRRRNGMDKFVEEWESHVRHPEEQHLILASLSPDRRPIRTVWAPNEARRRYIGRA